MASAKGTATVTFGPEACGTPKGVTRDKQPLPDWLTPSPQELATVGMQAEFNALERFEAEAGEATLANFERVKDTVAANLDEFILGSFELVRMVDTTARSVSITVRVDISVARLANLIQSTSAVGTTQETKRSLIGVFVMAREQASIERFSPEVHQDTIARAIGRRSPRLGSMPMNAVGAYTLRTA